MLLAHLFYLGNFRILKKSIIVLSFTIVCIDFYHFIMHLVFCFISGHCFAQF